MTDVPLFEARNKPVSQLYLCDLCPAAAHAHRDTLRVVGWTIYDGQSITGQTLHVRICPACQKGPRS